MGVVSSRPEDGATVCLRDQSRLSISSLVVSSPKKRTAITITPNDFPAGRLVATRGAGETAPLEYVQDPESNGAPNFLLKLSNEDEIIFNFSFVLRQDSAQADTSINGLTYVYAPSIREVENLVTREFHADPNLHKNSNVELVGDGAYSTGGNAAVGFDWTWKWKPPKGLEDRGGGWRNACSFVEYDQRAHKLVTLASFSFWVANTAGPLSQPSSPSPVFQLAVPPKIRVASAHSVESRISEYAEPTSPTEQQPQEPFIPVTATTTRETVKVDVNCPRPNDGMPADDGPVFRATIKALEQKTGNMRAQMKKVLKKAEQAHTSQIEANEAFVGFIDALREASSTNANAVQPALEHYFDKIAREILSYEKKNAASLQKVIIDPISKLYTYEIKQAEAKKRDFEEESKDFYAYVSRYLGQRSASVKEKKLVDSDNKYQTKRRNFELKRFDYSSFVQDLHGGRKEQEVLSHLTRFADTQARNFLDAAKKVDAWLPELQALSSEVGEADKEFQYQRREREEKRRVLEKTNGPLNEAEGSLPTTNTVANANGGQALSDTELGRADSTGSQLRGRSGNTGSINAGASELSRSPGSLGHATSNSPAQSSKFRGIRDLDERDMSQLTLTEKGPSQNKEGLLWALNRPGTHVDPLALNKQGWHKFWVVLDGGRLAEYSNWKQKLDLHMEPIDLRMASVREARNAERRFCFEVITPNFKRVYQATSDEDMNSWIASINNALQGAFERGGLKDIAPPPAAPPSAATSLKRDIGSMFTGKSTSLNHGSHHSHSGSLSSYAARRTTVGAKPGPSRNPSNPYDESPDKLVQALREADQGNAWCADCGSGTKVEWVSINLAIIVCIECSGIHRSLGTHISKVRSLTLDITSFTQDIIELLMTVGNRVANMIWEARLEPGIKISAGATREQRLKFITAKYVDRAYVEPISATLSRYPTPDETMLAAIKRNEIQQVIYALALKANPNTLDKSRGTHPVFLALAAADPASPSPSPTPSGPPGRDSETRTVAFPVAELLTQNGSEIPVNSPAFPLTRNAQMFLELKRGRTAANEATGRPLQNALAPPPSTSTSTSERLSRDKDRLQKRISAGGRLAKSPIPER